MLRPVVADALRRARDLAEALDARGFDPSLDRPIEAVRPAPLRWLLASAVGAGALAAIGLRVLFALYTADVWYAPGLRGVYGFVRAWL
jgi:energy-coupling factor transporter transmembrane protein EcfT